MESSGTTLRLSWWNLWFADPRLCEEWGTPTIPMHVRGGRKTSNALRTSGVGTSGFWKIHVLLHAAELLTVDESKVRGCQSRSRQRKYNALPIEMNNQKIYMRYQYNGPHYSRWCHDDLLVGTKWRYVGVVCIITSRFTILHGVFVEEYEMAVWCDRCGSRSFQSYLLTN